MAIKLYTRSWRVGTNFDTVSGLEVSDVARLDIVNWQDYDEWDFRFRGGVVLRVFLTDMPQGPDSPIGGVSAVELTQFDGLSGSFKDSGITRFVENTATSTLNVSYSGYNSTLDVYTPIDEVATTGFEPDSISTDIDGPTSVIAIELMYPFRGDMSIGVVARNRITHGLEGWFFPAFFRVNPFEDFDPNIFRVWLSTPVELPWACPQLPPNEWVTSDTINNLLAKFNDNLTYLKYASDAYFWPGWYKGWFGTSAVDVVPQWRSYIMNLSADLYNYNQVPYYAGGFDNIKDIKIYQDQFWLASNTWISRRGPDFYSSLTDWITAKPDLDTFGSIGAIDFDYPNGNLYVLDTKYNEVVVYNVDVDNVVTYLYRWGGSDTLLPKAKFLGTNDIHVDTDGNVFIVDTLNSCVKKFSPTGSWLLTIRHPEITGRVRITNGGPISVTTDQDQAIHVLTFRWVYVFDSTGKYLRKYSCHTGEQPKKIIMNYGNNGFVYVCYTNPTWGGRVIKFRTTGIVAGSVAEIIRNFRPASFNSVAHDKNRNLYIAANCAIYAFVDEVRVTSVTKQYWPPWFHIDQRYIEWPLSAIQVDREEFVQDWVYNRSFARLWDNMEFFRRSIYGKFVEQPFPLLPGLSSVFMNFMEINDEHYFDYQKEDLVIGMNEFVTYDVINRVASKLCANQEVLREMLLERPLPPIALQGEERERVESGDETLPPSPILNTPPPSVPPGIGTPDGGPTPAGFTLGGGPSIIPAEPDSTGETKDGFGTSGDKDPITGQTPDAIILSNALSVPPKLGGDGFIKIPGETSFENIRKSIFFPTFITPPKDTFCWSWDSTRDSGVNGLFWTETDPVTGVRPIAWKEATSECCTNNVPVNS